MSDKQCKLMLQFSKHHIIKLEEDFKRMEDDFKKSPQTYDIKNLVNARMMINIVRKDNDDMVKSYNESKKKS